MSSVSSLSTRSEVLDLLRREVGEVPLGAADAADAIGSAQPSVVARPTSAESTAGVIAAAERIGLAVTPRGGGTHIGVGTPPSRCDVVLSTAGLDRVLRHDAADMTVTVQAGATLEGLDRELGLAAQWLPIDAPLPASATVGGLIAADLNGGLRLGCGKVRDYLLGVRVVIGAGETVRGGGQVVKNVAGYDLPKLMVGSYGTLGVIVEATFKVRPRPVADVVVAVEANSLRAAADGALALLDGPVRPAALDVLNAGASEAAGLPPQSHIVVRLAGERAEVEVQRQRLAAALEVVVEVEEGTRRALRDFQVSGAGLVGARACALPHDLPLLLDEIDATALEFGVSWSAQTHAGNGVIRLRLADAERELAGAVRLLHWLRFRCRQLGGSVVVEQLPIAARGVIDAWGLSDANSRLMGRLKAALDPRGTFSPGRM